MDVTTHLPTETVRHSTAHRHATHLGAWELLGPIGSGEWSTVFRARPRGCPSHWPADYAVKVARSGDGGASPARTLFAREATIGRGVAHPHLIAVLSAQLDLSPHYLVLPLLEGATLRAALNACGPFATPHALWMVRQTAEALAALHEAGWIHADVKPDNIYVSPHGHATLIDLGFALRSDSAECAPGAALRGTLRYTAPEMISSAVSVDPRIDVYSLGATLFELLTGQPPFTDDDPGRLMLAHLQGAVPNPRRRLPGLQREVSHLLRAMLAKEPLRRPSAPELTRWLVDLEIVTLEERATEDDGDTVAASRQGVNESVDDQVGDIQSRRSGR